MQLIVSYCAVCMCGVIASMINGVQSDNNTTPLTTFQSTNLEGSESTTGTTNLKTTQLVETSQTTQRVETSQTTVAITTETTALTTDVARQTSDTTSITSSSSLASNYKTTTIPVTESTTPVTSSAVTTTPVTIPTTADQEKNQRGAWVRYNNTEYYVSVAGIWKTYDQSLELCKKEDATLALVKSDDVQTFISRMVTEDSPTPFGFYIGLKDNGTYSSWNDGTTLKYNSWYTSEPNGQEEHCVIMGWLYTYEENLAWRDVRCSSLAGFVCQRILESPQVTTQTSTQSTRPSLETSQPTTADEQTGTNTAVSSAAITIRPTNTPATEVQSTIIIALAVGVVILAVLVVLMTTAYCYRKRQAKNKQLLRLQNTNNVNDYVELHGMTTDNFQGSEIETNHPTSLDTYAQIENETQISKRLELDLMPKRDSTYVLMASSPLTESKPPKKDVFEEGKGEEAYEPMSIGIKPGDGRNIANDKARQNLSPTNSEPAITGASGVYEIMSTNNHKPPSYNSLKMIGPSALKGTHNLPEMSSNKSNPLPGIKETANEETITNSEDFADTYQSVDDLKIENVSAKQKVIPIRNLPLPEIPSIVDASNPPTINEEPTPYGGTDYKGETVSPIKTTTKTTASKKSNKIKSIRERIKGGGKKKASKKDIPSELPEPCEENDITPYGLVEHQEQKSTDPHSDVESAKRRGTQNESTNETKIQTTPLPAIPIEAERSMEEPEEIYVEIKSEPTNKSTMEENKISPQPAKIEVRYTAVDKTNNKTDMSEGQELYEVVDRPIRRNNKKRLTVIGPKGDEYALVDKEME